MKDLEERLVSLYRFGLLTYTYPEYRDVYELMLTGYAIKNNIPRKFVTDSLYYMYLGNGKKPVFGEDQ